MSEFSDFFYRISKVKKNIHRPRKRSLISLLFRTISMYYHTLSQNKQLYNSKSFIFIKKKLQATLGFEPTYINRRNNQKLSKLCKMKMTKKWGKRKCTGAQQFACGAGEGKVTVATTRRGTRDSFMPYW